MRKGRRLLLGVLIALVALGSVWGCSQRTDQQAAPKAAGGVPEGEKGLAEWGKAYPDEYASYLKTREGGQGKSKYKGSEPIDKLSQYPFELVLFDGFGFGVEFNEPRGHVYMLKDQLAIDPARKKAGGVCLSCKTPYASELKDKMGADYFKKPYDEVHKMIPGKDAELGLSCIDCHDPKTNQLRVSRWMLNDALKDMGKDPEALDQQEKRSLMCAQCHVTYVIPKDAEKQSVGLFFPWQKSKWGGISIEDIEAVIKSDKANYEWTSNVTGQKLGFIRHPEFELFSNKSTHWNAGLSCADCHMPMKKVGTSKITSHEAASPLKGDMKACSTCHPQGAEWLREQVIRIQDKTNALLTRSGDAAAQAARAVQEASATAGVDRKLIGEALDLYEKAYYRVTFVAAENSMGFHNPEEAMRVLGDGLYYAQRSEMKSREALLKAGVTPPAEFDLQLGKYGKRGTKGLPLQKELDRRYTADATN